MYKSAAVLVAGGGCMGVPLAKELEKIGICPILTVRKMEQLRWLEKRWIVFQTPDFVEDKSAEFIVQKASEIASERDLKISHVFYLASYLKVEDFNFEEMNMYYRLNRDMPFDTFKLFYNKNNSIEFWTIATPATRTLTGVKGIEMYTLSKKEGEFYLRVFARKYNANARFFWVSQIKGSRANQEAIKRSNAGQKWFNDPRELAEIWIKKMQRNNNQDIHGDVPAWITSICPKNINQKLCDL